MHVGVIIVAAGRSERMGSSVPKPLLELRGRSLLRHSVQVFDAHPLVRELVVVVPADLVHEGRSLVGSTSRPCHVVAGGERRQDSVRHGFDRISAGADLVLIHDAARPFVHEPLIDRVIQAGGYISAPTGTAPDAHANPVPKRDADRAFDAATCIGCGACVAACPNGSAMLFTAAKITHLGLLPQGQPERYSRVVGMMAQHDAEGFGGCTNIGECTAVCPKAIPLETISRLNRDLISALTHGGSHWPKAAPRRDELEEEEPEIIGF